MVAELVVGVDAEKAQRVRLLGFDPVVAVTINLVYSVAAVALFCWLVLRWLRWRSGSAR
jgi:hypothetical protein